MNLQLKFKNYWSFTLFFLQNNQHTHWFCAWTWSCVIIWMSEWMYGKFCSIFIEIDKIKQLYCTCLQNTRIVFLWIIQHFFEQIKTNCQSSNNFFAKISQIITWFCHLFTHHVNPRSPIQKNGSNISKKRNINRNEKSQWLWVVTIHVIECVMWNFKEWKNRFLLQKETPGSPCCSHITLQTTTTPTTKNSNVKSPFTSWKMIIWIYKREIRMEWSEIETWTYFEFSCLL